MNDKTLGQLHYRLWKANEASILRFRSHSGDYVLEYGIESAFNERLAQCALMKAIRALR